MAPTCSPITWLSQVTSIAGDAEAKRLAKELRKGPRRERRELLMELVRKVIIGDAELTIELADGFEARAVARSGPPWQRCEVGGRATN